MILERKAPAKVNLGLHVLRKRADGYHDIETVFLRISWCDVLTFRRAAGLALTCSDPALPIDESNLCMKAARRLKEAGGVKEGAAIHLEKRIPYGAGLGGGSSDAAAVLDALNALWDLHLDRASLMEIGAGLGSDVPFFLGASAAFGEGRGERLIPLYDYAGVLYRLPFFMVVVVPPVQVATADAYRLVKPLASGRPDLRRIVCSNDLMLWRQHLVNDFEPSVFERFPMVEEVKRQLLERGAGYATMSGSGSAVLGVFEEKAPAEDAAAAFREEKMRVWVGNNGKDSAV